MSSRRSDYPTSRRDPDYEQNERRRHNRYEHPSPSRETYPLLPVQPSYRPVKPRRRWPPQPSVEEESIALRREFGIRKSPCNDEVSFRGSVDQDPIILDVTPRASTYPSISDQKSASTPGFPTPPTSDDDNKTQRSRRHGPKLDTRLIPEMRRSPSPYSSSMPTSRKVSSTNSSSVRGPSGGYNIRADSTTRPLTPSPSLVRGSRQVSDGDTRVPTAQGISRPPSMVLDDVDLSKDEAQARRNQRRSTRHSFSRPIPSAEPVTTDQTEQRARKEKRRPLLSEDNRRHTDSYVGVSKDQILKQPQKPHVKIASLVREASSQTPVSPRTPSGMSSNRASPLASADHITSYPPSPPRSPRVSLDHGRDTGTTSRRPQQTSADTSRTNSPQASPKLSTSRPDSAGARSVSSDQSAPKRTSTRLSTATRPNDISRSPRPDTATCSKAGGLPYPTDDFMTAMPEERDHQYFPDGLRPINASPMFVKTLSRAGTPVVTRPNLQKHQSYNDNCTAATTPTSLPPRGSKQRVLADSSALAPPVTAAVPVMPPCERSMFVTGHEDWYTLEDCPNFDICSSCLMANFRDHYHYAFFQPVPPGTRSTNTAVRCDFSRPWLRLAWLLTLQRQLSNLNLLKLIYHHLEQSPPCPDIHAEPNTWYTVLDDVSRKPILSLSICQTDIRTIELLLRDLRGFFVPLPASKGSRSSSTTDASTRLCSLRSTSNNRFPLYLDSLISLHESASQMVPRALPDMTPFVLLVKHKLSHDECPRDNILQGAKWFFMPSLPELTVCEDCHDDVIVPLLGQDRELALRFNRRVEYLPLSKETRSARDSVSSFTDVAKEASCALYSARMRSAFMRAVDTNDLRGLSRVAKARRDMEVELQRRARPVIGRIGEVDEALLEAEEKGDRREIRRLEADRESLEKRLRGLQERWKEVE